MCASLLYNPDGNAGQRQKNLWIHCYPASAQPFPMLKIWLIKHLSYREKLKAVFTRGHLLVYSLMAETDWGGSTCSWSASFIHHRPSIRQFNTQTTGGERSNKKAFSSAELPFHHHLFSLLAPFNYSQSINSAYLLKIAARCFTKMVKWMNNARHFRIVVLKW